MDDQNSTKSKGCQNGFCLRAAEEGRNFCAQHRDADPNQFPLLGCLVALVIAGLLVWGAVTLIRGGNEAPELPPGLPDAASANLTNQASLARNADAYLQENFSDDPAYAVVQSVQVKTGVLWIQTSIPPGDTRSGTAVCGLGSAWAYGDPAAIDAGIWGVSVRASGGQRLVQREGPADDCLP